ncbi:MAG: Omp28-related outer membrane protein [Janthinobacterium lividum]
MLFFTIKTWKPALCLGLAGLLLTACDHIESPVKPAVTSTLTVRQQAVLDSIETKNPAPANVQRVLIEDMTGQYCGNCPSAARMADTLYRLHPQQVVVLEEHVTDYFAAPRPPDFPIDFRVAGTSQEIAKTYDLDNRGLPQGAVNRTPFASASNSLAATYSLWPAAVNAQLGQTPQQELSITTNYAPATRILQVKIASHYLSALTVPVRLGIAIAEDSLLGTQKDYRAPAGTVQLPGQETPNYVHRNVLRVVLAGTFGTQQVSNPGAGQQFNNYLSYQLPATWVAKRCRIMAYLANDNTSQILQVATAKVVR